MPSEPYEFSRAVENLIAAFRGLPENTSRSTRRKTREAGDLIEALMVKHQVGRASPEQTLREHWPELVGTANAQFSHAVRIERGRLTVATTHGVVRNELFHHRGEIVEKIRKLPGCEGVRDLLLRSG